jgi:putative membrane protein
MPSKSPQPAPVPAPAAPRDNRLFNGFRGSLIGVAEALPGISGGTIALITGVYEGLIGAASQLATAARVLVTGRGMARVREEFRRVDWGLILPLMTGMAVGLLLSAKLLAPLVEDHTQYAYAVFFGLVLASLWVPYTGSGRRWRGGDYALALLFAGLAFWLTSLSVAGSADSRLVVMGAGAIAVCALILPGLSGSFLLLALGMYEPTIDAVNERDLGYLSVFAVGMVMGLALAVKSLRWLLARYHHLTLVVLTGIMAGALRALWPWQGDEHDRSLRAPTDAVPLTVALAAAGFALVVTVLVVAHRRGHATGPGPGSTPSPTRRRHARTD